MAPFLRRIFPPEPNTILPSNAMIQRWLWFVADCIPPDYVLLGRQADFEGIQDLALVLVGFRQARHRRFFV